MAYYGFHALTALHVERAPRCLGPSGQKVEMFLGKGSGSPDLLLRFLCKHGVSSGGSNVKTMVACCLSEGLCTQEVIFCDPSGLASDTFTSYPLLKNNAFPHTCFGLQLFC